MLAQQQQCEGDVLPLEQLKAQRLNAIQQNSDKVKQLAQTLYNKMLSDKELTIKSLQTELIAAKIAINEKEAKLKSEIATGKLGASDMKKIRNELAQEQNKVLLLQTEVAEKQKLQEEASMLASKLKANEDTLQRKISENISLSKQASQIQNELQQAGTNVDKLTNELKSIDRERNRLEDEIQSIKQNNDRLNKLLTDVNKQNEDLQSQVKYYKKQADNIQIQGSQQIETLEKKLMITANSLEQKSAELENIKNQRSRTDDLLRQQKGDIQLLEQKLKAEQAQQTLLQQEIEHVRYEFDVVNEELNAAKQENTQLNIEIKTLRKAELELKASVAAKDKFISANSIRIAELHAEISSVRQR
jgi:chromosome segregation ATPase